MNSHNVNQVLERLRLERASLEEFCRRNHIRRLWFFGSVLRDDFGPESDVDVLYEFEEGKTPGLGIFRVEDEIAQVIGRPVDFVAEAYVDWKLRKHPSFSPEIVFDGR